MAVNAAMVKELRERSGAGMMECKKALVAVDGDMDAAIEHLRKAGLAQADKKAGRVAADGKVMLAQNDSAAVLVEVNCETDFVGKDDNFTGYAQSVADQALGAETDDVGALMSQPHPNGGTFEEARQALVTKVGENVQVRRISRMTTAEGGVIGAYLHGGRIGVLVRMTGGSQELARDIAMHIAAMNPAYLDADSVPEDVVAKEREILRAQAKDSGKPPEIIEKMVDGRLRKYFAETTLLGQPYVKDSDHSVGKFLKQQNAEVHAFSRVEVGEGIDKDDGDFAAEVRAQLDPDGQ